MPAIWLAVLAGPLSFGIAAPSLIVEHPADSLAVPVSAVTWCVTALTWARSFDTYGVGTQQGSIRYGYSRRNDVSSLRNSSPARPPPLGAFG